MQTLKGYLEAESSRGVLSQDTFIEVQSETKEGSGVYSTLAYSDVDTMLSTSPDCLDMLFVRSATNDDGSVVVIVE